MLQEEEAMLMSITEELQDLSKSRRRAEREGVKYEIQLQVGGTKKYS